MKMDFAFLTVVEMCCFLLVLSCCLADTTKSYKNWSVCVRSRVSC